MVVAMSRAAAEQIDLFTWAEELECEEQRVATANRKRATRRGFIVIATNPDVHPDDPDYRRVYATEAQTPARAIRKVRPYEAGRRLRAYLATGQYKHELANAAWVS